MLNAPAEYPQARNEKLASLNTSIKNDYIAAFKYSNFWKWLFFELKRWTIDFNIKILDLDEIQDIYIIMLVTNTSTTLATIPLP